MGKSVTASRPLQNSQSWASSSTASSQEAGAPSSAISPPPEHPKASNQSPRQSARHRARLIPDSAPAAHSIGRVGSLQCCAVASTVKRSPAVSSGRAPDPAILASPSPPPCLSGFAPASCLVSSLLFSTLVARLLLPFRLAFIIIILLRFSINIFCLFRSAACVIRPASSYIPYPVLSRIASPRLVLFSILSPFRHSLRPTVCSNSTASPLVRLATLVPPSGGSTTECWRRPQPRRSVEDCAARYP
ncbi:hypothetical protein J3F83DRAFT_724816 [Trichoderma novae-zelandiae]